MAIIKLKLATMNMKLTGVFFIVLLTLCNYGQSISTSDTGIFSRKAITYSSQKFDYDLIIGNNNTRPTNLFSDALNEFEYCTKINSTWNKFKMPLDFIPGKQATAVMDLDSIGEKEFLIKGLLKTFNGKDSVVEKVILIFDLTSVPTQIFRLHYACIPLSLYNETNYTVWETSKDCEIHVEIENNLIQISNANSSNNNNCCNKNRIENGSYIMKEGKIVKKT